jgi:hypothetical protein
MTFQSIFKKQCSLFMIGTVWLCVTAKLYAQDAVPAVNPSRPSITNSPDIGTTGVLEVDIGTTIDNYKHAASIWSTPVLVKYTISDNFEVRAGTNGFGFCSQAVPDGLSDATLWLQWVPKTFSADDIHWSLAVGSDASVVSPSSWDYTGNVAIAKNFGNCIFQSNLNLGVAASLDDRPMTYSGTFLFSYLLGTWSPFADVCYSSQTGTDVSHQVYLMGGTGLSVTPQVVLDVAIEREFHNETTTVLLGCSFVVFH